MRSLMCFLLIKPEDKIIGKEVRDMPVIYTEGKMVGFRYRGEDEAKEFVYHLECAYEYWDGKVGDYFLEVPEFIRESDLKDKDLYCDFLLYEDTINLRNRRSYKEQFDSVSIYKGEYQRGEIKCKRNK